MNKAIALCRVSTDSQQQDGHSLESQEQNIRDMAQELELELVHIARIAKSSRKGKNIRREDLEDALKMCKADKNIKYFLIDRVNRFMREMEVLFYYKVKFRDNGVEILFCDPQQRDLNGDNLMAKLKTAFKAYEAEADNDERIETVLSRMKARNREGYYLSHPKPGYRTSTTPGLHMPDGERFTLLQQALRAIASQEMTPKEANTWLRVSGYRLPAGKVLDMHKFSRIISDSYYAGNAAMGKWHEEWVAGKHKSMITPEEYEINLALISGRTEQPRKKHNPDNPLNLAKHDTCATDKCKITGIDHSNGKGWSRKEYLFRECKKRVPREVVHEAFSIVLDEMKPSEESIDVFKDALRQVWQKNEGFRIAELQNLLKRKETLQEEKSQLIRSLSTNPEYAQEIKEEIEKVKADTSKVNRAIQEASSVDEEREDFMAFALGYSENLREKWWSLPPERRVECKQVLFHDEILVSLDGNVYTPKMSAIYTLLNTKSDPKVAQNVQMVELAGTAPASIRLTS